MNEKQKAAIEKFRDIVLEAKENYESLTRSLGKVDIAAWTAYDDLRAAAIFDLGNEIPILRGVTTSDLLGKINNLPEFIKERVRYFSIETEKKEKKKNAVIEESKTDTDISKPKKKGRGRGRKAIEIKFPAGKFTIPELAKELNVSVTTIYNAMDKNIKKVGEVKRRPGQRGKLTPIYRVLTKD